MLSNSIVTFLLFFYQECFWNLIQKHSFEEWMLHVLGPTLSNLCMIYTHLNISSPHLLTDCFEVIHSAAQNIWPNVNRLCFLTYNVDF